MMLSNDSGFSGASWEVFSSPRAWILSSTPDGEKYVYAKFKDATGNGSLVSTDSIILDTTVPTAPTPPDLAAADDTGISNTDNLTKNTTGLTFTGSGAEGNATVTLYSNIDGSVGSTTADGVGYWSVDVSLTANTHGITGVVTDLAGNVSSPSGSLTVTVDTTAPTVLSVVPADGSTGVLVTTTATVTFSESMDTSATEGAFSLIGAGAVSGSFGWSSGDTVLTFTPSGDLAYSTSHTVTAGTGSKEAAGNVLGAVFSSGFTTVQPPPIVLTPVADTFCATGGWSNANQNYNNHGYELPLGVESGSTFFRIFVKWDLSSIPPGKTIVSAYMRYFVNQANAQASINCTATLVTGSWSEGGLTWNTMPTLGSNIVNVTVTSVGWTNNFAITSTVQDWYSNSLNNFGVMIWTSQNDQWLTFGDRESPSDDKPQLVVTYQ